MELFQKDDLPSIIHQCTYPEDIEQRIRELFGVDMVTYPNLKGSHEAYQKYILLSTQRSGSALLTLLLRSHPHIVCYNELFHQDHCEFDYPFFPEKDHAEMISFRNAKPVEFLNKLIFRPYQPDFSAVGFKVHYSQLNDSRFNPVFSQLVNDPEIRIIHLKRQNRLRMLVSLELAKASGQWWRSNPEFRKKAVEAGLKQSVHTKSEAASSYNTMMLKLDYRDVQLFFQNTETQINQYDQFFSAHPCLTVFYEELERDRSVCIKKIQGFLNAPERDLFAPISKQNDRLLRETISNYDELKSLFKGQAWELFFDE